MHRRLTVGFTLIELLIVVAIIAILAALAIPNYEEAQIRAKVATVKSNMRTMATTLEMYQIDHNQYPVGFTQFLNEVPNGALGWPSYPSTEDLIYGEVLLNSPTTNNAQKLDVFNRTGPSTRGTPTGALVYYNLRFMNDLLPKANWTNKVDCNWKLARELGGEWALHSVGPCGLPYEIPAFDWPGVIRIEGDKPPTDPKENVVFHEYDPTNGAVSLGFIYRTQRNPTALGFHPYYWEAAPCPYDI